MDDAPEQHIAHCSACGCKMDISPMEPYTNVVCPDCGYHTRVKCELGQYLLVARHAVGGMSRVFKATDLTLNRDVAIKILNEDYSHDEQRMRQFEHEAKITAAISHPHVVRVFTVGKVYGHFYIAMELVPGESLEQRIAREKAIGEEVMLPIAAEIISGLRAAKQAGLIHRDVKPGNILFDAQGHVKIVDFGLALVTQGGKATAAEIWATPYYVAPEALEGAEEDFRSDIYALGATLFHALSGQPPFSEQIKSTRAVAKAKEGIPPLADVAPWLKPETCQLVDKALALRPENRFASYEAMEEAWRAARDASLGGGPSGPIRGHERAHRRVKSKHRKSGLIIASVVGLVLGCVTIGVLWNRGAGDEPSGNRHPRSDAGLVDGADDYDPEVAASIARQFRVAHEMLREKKYNESREVFTRLMHDDHVKEPTSSWAGVEAVIAALLGGDSGDASVAISDLQEHMAINALPDKGRLGRLGRQLQAPGVIPGDNIEHGAMAVVHLMAVALKNWETGAWDAAVPLFEQVGEKYLPNGSPLTVYRDIARRYLSDFERLKPVSGMPPPGDVDEAKRRLSDLRLLLGELETRGRARFHVRVWQLRLHHQIKDLRRQAEQAGEKIDKAPGYDVALAKFHELIAASKFSAAAEVLRDVSLEEALREERDAWVYLADSAGAFLGELEEAMSDAGAAVRIVAMDGQVYPRIIRSRRGGVDVGGGRGDLFLPWLAIQPDSVLSIYQKVFPQTLTTMEGQLRVEQAICYLWLCGKRDKAGSAASKLSEVNGNFRKRWENTMREQRESP